MPEVSQMVLWLFISLLDNFGPQKNQVPKSMTDKTSLQAIFYFFTYYTTQIQMVLRKKAVEISLFNIPIVVCKRILNINEIPYIYDSFPTFLCVYQNS